MRSATAEQALPQSVTASIELRAIAFFRRSRECTVRQRTLRGHPYLVLILGMLPALAAAACDWSRPGAAPYRSAGDITAAKAVESYTDMPQAVRADLMARIRGQREDAVVMIGRDSMRSAQGTVTDLRDMHWRGGMCAGPVVRTGWPEHTTLPALVYCSGRHCVCVPVICGNVSRCTFTPHERGQGRRLEGPAVQQPHPVPEPGTLLLALAGVALCVGRHRRKARDAA